jgi:hypothetical protein
MLKLETIDFLLRPYYLLPVGRHVGVVAVLLSHHLVDDELRVSPDL